MNDVDPLSTVCFGRSGARVCFASALVTLNWEGHPSTIQCAVSIHIYNHSNNMYICSIYIYYFTLYYYILVIDTVCFHMFPKTRPLHQTEVPLHKVHLGTSTVKGLSRCKGNHFHNNHRAHCRSHQWMEDPRHGFVTLCLVGLVPFLNLQQPLHVEVD